MCYNDSLKIVVVSGKNKHGFPVILEMAKLKNKFLNVVCSVLNWIQPHDCID